MDLGVKNVPPENFPYELDEEGQIVDSESPAGIRLRYERLRKRVGEQRGSERRRSARRRRRRRRSAWRRRGRRTATRWWQQAEG